jgi:hypothetical protein
MHKHKGNGPFRIILLARVREQWWEQLKREPNPEGSIYAGSTTQHFALPPVAMGSEERLETFHLALKAYADLLGKPVPESTEPDLEAPYFDSILIIQMYALGLLEGIDLKDEEGILDSALHREERFWESHLKARGLPSSLLPGVGRILCVVTLGGGVANREDLVSCMEQLKAFNGQSRAVLEGIADLLHTLYSGKSFVEPLQPDILGEHLVERELLNDSQEVFDLVLGP